MNKKLFVPILSIFLDILGFSFILPIVPFIVKGFGGDSLAVGFIVSAAAMGMFLGGLLFGRLSDKFGRKNILLITILLNIFGYLLFSVSTNLKIFFLARFLCGLGGGGASVVQAYIGDNSTEKERIVNMGYVGAAIGLGFTLGPIFGSLISSLSLTHMGYVSAILLSVSFLLVILFMSDTKVKYEEGIPNLKGASKKLLLIFSTYFVNILTFAGIQTIFGLFLNNDFGVSSRNVGYTFGFLGVVSIIYQVFFIKYAYEKLGEKNMVTMGLSFVGVGLVLLGFNSNFYLMYLILILIGIGISNVNSAIFSLIIRFSHNKDYGKNLGLSTAFGSSADIVGPLISGYLFLLGHHLPFYFFGLVLISTSLLFNFFLRVREPE